MSAPADVPAPPAEPRPACDCGATRASIREIVRGDGPRPEGYVVSRGRILHGPRCAAAEREAIEAAARARGLSVSAYLLACERAARERLAQGTPTAKTRKATGPA